LGKVKKDFFTKNPFVTILYNIDYTKHRDVIDINIQKTSLNKKQNCPIILQSHYNFYYKFPPLYKFKLHQILSAKEIYQMLVDWLSTIKNENENKPDNRTNNEKIISKGFDIKKSFRPKIKI
jgi:hypothetical protein